MFTKLDEMFESYHDHIHEAMEESEIREESQE